jgi:hypothetical protein
MRICHSYHCRLQVDSKFNIEVIAKLENEGLHHGSQKASHLFADGGFAAVDENSPQPYPLAASRARPIDRIVAKISAWLEFAIQSRF